MCIPFFWDRRLKNTPVSGALRAMLGLEGNAEPTNSAITSLIHPDDLDRVTAACWRAVKTGGALDLVLRII